MTSAVIHPSSGDAPSRPSAITELFRREPVFAGLGLVLLVLIFPTLIAMSVDPRTLLDVSVWSKPLKFELALAIYVITLAWFAGWLPEGMTQTRWYRIFVRIVAFCIVAEMVWLIGAAANGVPSHFNTTSAFMTAVYGLMGLFALILTSASLVYGVVILRHRTSRLDPAFRLSVGLGLVLTFVLTTIVAGFMSGWNSHFVGGNLSDAEAVPLMGWARDGGDLRVAHFFATHALHIIPAFGFLVSRMLNPHQGRRAVLAFSALFIAFVGYTFGQALMGQPFLPMLG